jgi:hypothetical protein
MSKYDIVFKAAHHAGDTGSDTEQSTVVNADFSAAATAKFRSGHDDVRVVSVTLKESSHNDVLRKLVREILEEENLDEESSSGAAGAYATPFAFGKRRKASGMSKQEKPVKFGESKEK